MSITADELIQRNAKFATAGSFADLPFPSNRTLRIISCVDSRVDPSLVLGLDLGDAVIMRNIGGRVTPAVLRSWALLGKLGQARPSGQPGDGPPHMVILHHTDCGIKALAEYPELLAEHFRSRLRTWTPRRSMTRARLSGSTLTSPDGPYRSSSRAWSMTRRPASWKWWFDPRRPRDSGGRLAAAIVANQALGGALLGQQQDASGDRRRRAAGSRDRTQCRREGVEPMDY